MRPSPLDDALVVEWVASHAPWRLEGGHLVRDVVTVDYPSCVALLAEQVAVAEDLDHHPIVTVGYRTLSFELWTHDVGAITTLDLDYAARLEDLLAHAAHVVLD